MATACLRMTKVGWVTTGGSQPWKRAPLPGSSQATSGLLMSAMSLRWAATSLMMLAACSGAMRWPVFSRPSPSRSTRSVPSGLSMISMTAGSAR